MCAFFVIWLTLQLPTERAEPCKSLQPAAMKTEEGELRRLWREDLPGPVWCSLSFTTLNVDL